MSSSTTPPPPGRGGGEEGLGREGGISGAGSYISLQEQVEKDQMLSPEYAKIRAQNVVLKKAVLQEQAVSQQLRTAALEKDRALRKGNEELDMLNFHNKRLTSRIEVLQAEVDGRSGNSSRGGGTGGANSGSAWLSFVGGASKKSLAKSQENLQVSNAELAAKIEENKSLHLRIHECERRHAEEITEMEARLFEQRTELSQLRQRVTVLTGDQDKLMERLGRETSAMRLKSRAAERELAITRGKLEDVQVGLEDRISELQAELADCISLKNRSVTFDLGAQTSKNALNVPTYDKYRHDIIVRLSTKGLGLSRELTSALQDFFTYSDQRCRLNEPMLDAAAHLSALLSEHPLHLESVVDAMTIAANAGSSREGHIDMENDVITAVCGLLNYWQRVIPLQRRNIEIECSDSSCIATLRTRYMLMHSTLDGIRVILENIVTEMTSVKDLYDPGTLCSLILELHNELKQYSTQLASMASQEARLPTTRREVKANNDCILTSLVSLVTVSGLIQEFLAVELPQLIDTVEYPHRAPFFREDQDEIAVAILQSRATGFMARLTEVPEPESIPYALALQQNSIVKDSSSSQSDLQSMLTASTENLRRLEEEREHWMLECQLLNSKLKKQQDLLAALSEQLTVNGIIPASSKSMEASRTVSLAVTPTILSPSVGSTPVPGSPTIEPNATVGLPEVLSSLDIDRAKESLVDSATEISNSVTTYIQTEVPGTSIFEPERSDSGPEAEVSDELSIDGGDDEKTVNLEGQLPPPPLNIGLALARGNDTPPMVVSPSMTRHAPTSTLVVTSMLQPEDVAREELIKRHFSARTSQLTVQLQLSESKAIAFATEAQVLAQKLNMCIKSRDLAIRDLEESSSVMGELKDELATTERNYGTQINLLTEHICSINVKLSNQTEELESLRRKSVYGRT